MQPVLNIDDVKRVEVALTREGVSVAELMHRAGLAAAREALEFGQVGNVVVLAGLGNNGGDGWVAAEALHERGVDVTVVSPIDPDALSGDLSRQVAQSAVRAGVSVLVGPSRDELEELLAPADVVLDCMLGTGFHGEPRPPFDIWIECVNACSAHVLSVDVPSGLSAETGRAAGACVVADMTVTMISLKPGLLADDGRDASGAIVVAPLAEQTERLVIDEDPVAWRTDLVDYLGSIAPRTAAVDKFSRGSVLVVGGFAAKALDKFAATNADNKITSVHLMGYASPEGPYANNVKLAANRAAAVKNYLVNNKLVDASLITVDFSPANWDALKQMLTESCINDYRRIIGVIDDPSIKPENKNAEIRRRFPVEYDFMLRTWYPKLRVTDYTIDYSVRPYSVDEAKRLVYTDPVQLSPAEIYMVALTFEEGSKEWNDIILIAVQTYPQSPESRVNAANVAMANGNYTQAAEYLDGVSATMPEAMNSRGILAMAQGDYQQAMTLFQQAREAGVQEAAYNISLLKQLMQADS